MFVLPSGLGFINAATAKIQLSSPVYVTSAWAGFSQASAVYQLNSNGYVYTGNYTTTQTFVQQEQWCTPASAASGYEVFATLNTGTLSSGTTGSWVPLSGTQSWRVTVPFNTAQTTNIAVQIRKVGTTTVLASSSVQLYADTTNF